MRTTRSDLDSQASQNRESSQGYAAEALGRLRRYGLQEGASVGTPWLQQEDMGQEVSPSISQTYNKLYAPFENEKRSVIRFLNWSSFIIFDYVLGWVYEKYITIICIQTLDPIQR